MAEVIKHPGTVVNIEDKKVYVRILSVSACATCEAKGACMASETQDKIIEVYNPGNKAYKPGGQVIVIMHKSLGPLAVFLGYFAPFLAMFLALILALFFTNNNEALSALVAICTLILYFSGLYLLRDKLRQKFEFRLAE